MSSRSCCRMHFMVLFMVLLRNTLNQNVTDNFTAEYNPDLNDAYDHFPSGNVDIQNNETIILPMDNFIPEDEIENILSGDDVKSFLESIPDSFAREATRLHIKYCPFTSLCSFSVGFRSNLFMKECCAPCSCTSGCEITGNCCPDHQSGKYFDNIRRDNYQGNCHHAAFVEDSQLSLPGDGYYFFISECPFSAKEFEIDACVRPKRPTTLEKFLDIIPVTDKSNRINYKNRHCAACNKIMARNLTYWSMVLQCTVDVNLEAQNLNTIMQFIDNNQCNLLYKPDDDVGHNTPVCTPMVTKCNLTGKWRGNSDIVETACIMNIGSIYENIDGLYANIYCMLCNEYVDRNPASPVCTQKEPSLSTDEISFSAILNFVNDVKQPEKSMSCGAERMLDPYKKECRSLYCSSTRRLINNECVHLFREVKDAKFELVLEFDIDEQCPVYHANELIDEMTAWFFVVLQRSIPSSSVCCKEVIYKIDYNYNDLILDDQSAADYSVNLSNIEYIASKWIFQINGFYSYERMYAFVQNITNVAERLVIKKSTVYTIRPQLTYIDDEAFMIFNGLSDDFFFHAIDDRTSLPLSQLLLFAYPSKVDNKTIIPHLEPNNGRYCPAVETLIKLPFDILPCTLIEINKEEYEWSIIQHGVTLPGLNLYLNMTDFVTTNDSKNRIRICSEKYIASFNEKSLADKKKISVETIVSVTCTGTSLICLVVTFIIYLRFPILMTGPGKNNMVLIVNLIFAQLLYLMFVVSDTFSGWACKLVGILLHFFWLSAVLWLNICTFHMFKVFVRLNKPNSKLSSSKTLFKYTLAVITVSIFLVLVNVIKGLAESGMTEIGYGSGICYISSVTMVGYTFALPVGFVVLSNLFMFLVVIYKVRSLPNVEKNVKHDRNNVVIFTKLSSLTGITWIFGFLYQLTNEVALSLVFIVLNASLGVFIMMSFVINRRVLRLVQGTSPDTSASIPSSSKRTTHYTKNSATF